MSTQQLKVSELQQSFQSIKRKQSQGQAKDKFKLYSLEKAEIHRLAFSFGQPLKDSKVCECCQKKYQKNQIKLCFQKQQIAFYGEGLSLYFQFLKMTIILTGLIVAIFAIPMLILNYKGQACSTMTQLYCSNTIFILFSAANKLDNMQYGKLQSVLSAIAILCTFIVVQIFRKRFNDIQQNIQYLAGAQKYTVFGNAFLREGETLNQEQIHVSVNNWWKRQAKLNKNIQQQINLNEQIIEDVFISYDVHIGKQIKQRTLELMELVQIQQSIKIMQEYKSEIQQLKIKVDKVQIKTNNKFLIIFKYEKIAKYFVERVNKNQLQLLLQCQTKNLFQYNQASVQIYKAPLPSEILWQNHHIKGQQKVIKRILIYLLTFFLLLAGQSLVFLVLYLWFTQGDSSSSFSTYISGLVSAFITVINFILYEVFIFISKFQFRSISLEDQISKSIKIIISVCLNSGIMLLGAYFIVNLNTIWETNGFVDTISYTFIYAIFTPHIFKYVNLYNIFKFYNYLKIKSGDGNLTQNLANKQYQKAQGYESYHYYCWEVTLLWMACFFGPIIPLAFVCVFITFFIQYWLQKINYLFLYKEQKPWGSLLNQKMTDIIQISQFLFALGTIVLQIILKTLRNESIDAGPLAISIFLIVFTTIHIFILPKNSIIKLLTCWYCKQQVISYKYSYQQAKNIFIIGYQEQIKKHFNKQKIKDINWIKNELIQKIQYLQSLVNFIQQSRSCKNGSREDTEVQLIEVEPIKKIQISSIETNKHNKSMEFQNSPKKNRMNLQHQNYFKTLKTIKQESSYFSSKKYSNI